MLPPKYATKYITGYNLLIKIDFKFHLNAPTAQ